MIDERMAKAAFNAKELAIMSVDIAIARDYSHQLSSPRAERHLAAVRTIRASRNGLIQLPGPRLMAIRTVQQGSCWTNLDAVAALGTIQPTTISSDHSVCAAIARFDGLLAHPFIAHSGATLAENATLRIVGDHRRKILLRLGILPFNEALFEIAPIERELLQFALAAAIAHGTIKRVIREQKLEHRTLRFVDLFALGCHDHAVIADNRARGLQLRHLLDAHEAHATRCLQSEIGVVAEGGNIELVLAAHVD